VLTEESRVFDGIWPTVFTRGVKALQRRGVGQAAAEDAVQEAGARAIAQNVPFQDADDLLRWIHTVSWRVVLDARKRDQRLVYEVPEEGSGEDVGRAVEQRLRLQLLRVVLGGLTPDERAALTADGRGTDRRTSTRLAVRRHRVRVKLIAMLDGAAALVALLRHAVSPPRTRRVATVAAPALIAMSVLTTASLLVQQGTPTPHIQNVDGAATQARVSIPIAPPQVTSTRGRTATDPAAPPRLQRVRVDYERPDGDGQVTIRPKQPADHFVCLDLNQMPTRCADLPIRITG
jgi:hypothetical protein